MILLINDYIYLNELYRKRLRDDLKNKYDEIFEYGLKELNFSNSLGFLLKKNIFLISFNLRSNLYACIFIHLPGVVVINGLGRFRSKRIMRTIFIFIFKYNRHKSFVFQNYGDYRYFCRYAPGLNCIWIPGSGGSARKFILGDSFVIVSRDTKLPLVKESIIEFIKMYSEYKFYLIGCTEEIFFKYFFECKNLVCIGKVRQDEMFLRSEGNNFLYPSGYGEGLGHALVDALVSGMNVVMTKKEFIRTGLGRIGFWYKEIDASWGNVIGCSGALDNLSVESVNEKYLIHIDKALENKF